MLFNRMAVQTRLEAFLKSHRIRPAHLARESGYSRQHLLRIRMGRMEPTRACIAAIVSACRRLAHAFGENVGWILGESDFPLSAREEREFVNAIQVVLRSLVLFDARALTEDARSISANAAPTTADGRASTASRRSGSQRSSPE